MNARYFGLVPAAGSGSRFGADVLKQYSPLAGKPMLYHSIGRLLATPEVEIAFVVLAPADTEFRRHDWKAFGETRCLPARALRRRFPPPAWRAGARSSGTASAFPRAASIASARRPRNANRSRRPGPGRNIAHSSIKSLNKGGIRRIRHYIIIKGPEFE